MSSRSPVAVENRRRSIVRYTFALSLLAIVAYLFGSACGQEGIDFVRGDAEQTRTTGMALSVQTDPDIDQMRFDIERVACDAEDSFEPFSYTHTGALEDLQLPAGIPEFVGQPYDAGSEHAFADHYVVLETGCYDVSVTPLDDAGNASEVCTPATQSAVRVEDGLTTEVVLISQCEGDETGGLDTVAAVNVAPTLTALVYQPSKFVEACVPNEICATAMDPDTDPLEFVWDRVAGPDASGEPTVLSHTREGDAVTECIQVTPETAGTYDYEVVVYDMGFDEAGDRARLEDVTGEDSHDTLSFPVYAGEADEAICPPADDDDDVTPPDEDEDDVVVPEPCVDVGIGELQNAGSRIVDGEPYHAVLVVPENACPIKVSFSSYGFDDKTPQPFPEQNLYDNATDIYPPGTYDIFIELPPTCGFQTDLYLGDPIFNLIPNVGIPGELRIAAEAGFLPEYCEGQVPGQPDDIGEEPPVDDDNDEPGEEDADLDDEDDFPGDDLLLERESGA